MWKTDFLKVLKGTHFLHGGRTNSIFGFFLDIKVTFKKPQIRYFNQNKRKV